MSGMTEGDYFEDICGAFLDETPEDAAHVLLVAQVDAELVGGDIYYRMSADEAPRRRLPSRDVMDEVVAFWKAWKGELGKPEWRVAVFYVQGERFRTEFLYPDQVPEGQFYGHDPVLQRYFGRTDVDHSEATAD